MTGDADAWPGAAEAGVRRLSSRGSVRRPASVEPGSAAPGEPWARQCGARWVRWRDACRAVSPGMRACPAPSPLVRRSASG